MHGYPTCTFRTQTPTRNTTNSKINYFSNVKPIDAAIAAADSQEFPNYSAIAREFGVDRSTLSRRHRGVTFPKPNATEKIQLLSNAQEHKLISYLNQLCYKDLLPTSLMVRNFAHELADCRPSKNWVSRFIRRHQNQLESRYLAGQESKRKKAENWYNFKHFFDLVCSCFETRNPSNN